MRENMLYDTDIYQLRGYTLERMMAIIRNQYMYKPQGTVFFGDSITEYCDLNQWFPHMQNKYNCGVAGITSDMLLHFIDEGVIKYQPSQVIMMIGTNDLGNTVMASPRQIALNVKEMIEIIHQNLPHCKIYLVSCIPCLENIHGYQATHQGLRSNETLQMIMQEYRKMIYYEYVHFIDVFDAFCDCDGKPIEKYFVDGLHINEEGYRIYTQMIKIALGEVYEE